jgi:hypothetical protein
MYRAAVVFVIVTVSCGAAATTGCTRTSDGSIVMRKPTLLGRVLNFRNDDHASGPTTLGPPVYTQMSSVAPTRPAKRRLAPVAVPSMNLSKNAPFKRADPNKPLACHNEKSASGRIRVVCT